MRAARCTFNDLARAAKVKDVVTRSISGHTTEAMQRHYSTVRGEQQRQGIARVVDVMTVRARRGSAPSDNASSEVPLGPSSGSETGPSSVPRKVVLGKREYHGRRPGLINIAEPSGPSMSS
jgi:hypothetical protein